MHSIATIPCLLELRLMVRITCRRRLSTHKITSTTGTRRFHIDSASFVVLFLPADLRAKWLWQNRYGYAWQELHALYFLPPWILAHMACPIVTLSPVHLLLCPIMPPHVCPFSSNMCGKTGQLCRKKINKYYFENSPSCMSFRFVGLWIISSVSRSHLIRKSVQFFLSNYQHLFETVLFCPTLPYLCTRTHTSLIRPSVSGLWSKNLDIQLIVLGEWQLYIIVWWYKYHIAQAEFALFQLSNRNVTYITLKVLLISRYLTVIKFHQVLPLPAYTTKIKWVTTTNRLVTCSLSCQNIIMQ
jgi:hypothetical protein